MTAAVCTELHLRLTMEAFLKSYIVMPFVDLYATACCVCEVSPTWLDLTCTKSVMHTQREQPESSS